MNLHKDRIETTPFRFSNCKKHGKYVSETIDQFGYRYVCACAKCKAEEKIKEIFNRAFIPFRFQDRAFSNYRAVSEEQKQAVRMIENFVQSVKANKQGGQMLVLSGWPGTGKTHLAIAAAKELMEADVQPLFTSVAKIIRDVRETWNSHSEKSEKEVFNSFNRAGLLIIDEIGVSTGSENEKQILFSIINERYENMLPTILISNLDRDGIEAYIGTRSFDRLKECAYFVQFRWNSFRPQKAAEEEKNV